MLPVEGLDGEAYGRIFFASHAKRSLPLLNGIANVVCLGTIVISMSMSALLVGLAVPI